MTNTSRLLACFFAVSLSGCGGPDTRCNGHDALCDRRYDEVTYAATHNAFAVTGIYAASNQTRSVLMQLEDGVRGLMLDTHYNAQDVPSYCHGPCAIGQEPLVDGLRVIRDFLDDNPREVVTLIFEAHITSADTAAAFEASGLIELVHRQPLNQPWPTLREMIETNQRLVVLTDAGYGDYDWYLEQFAYGFQNDYAAESAEDFTCPADRGQESNSLFIMNHFLTRVFGREDLAAMVNPYDVLAPRVAQCWAETGKRPNFVTVDFYEIGDLLRVVDEMNGVADSGVTITGP